VSLDHPADKMPSPTLLEDYRPPAFLIGQVELVFELDPRTTRVRSTLHVVRNRADARDLVLNGDELELESLAMDGRALASSEFAQGPRHLTVIAPPERFTLEIVNRISPSANTSLMGLFVSNGIFCTQCEAQGFRRITYFLDRPDVMARYKVRIEGDRALLPVLLANGNLMGAGELPGNRHFAEWEDPFPKPAYLFALVAGDLAMLEDRFVTRSGRPIELRLYAEAAAIDQCRWALDSLKRSMAWDEKVYGLEYDLDLFMIVGVSDFNFGAMENKGLNIFNTSALLARSDTSTDADFQQVERIVAHEYFHNWTGNRVTCRDWFQLTLKEGLTVFRDQQFAADTHSAAVKRISDVVLLRETQFAEDAGPLAHPIRPDSYLEINNFYTRTVYEKGAEVIRMIHTLIGPAAFQRGIELYFERHDGSAVTCEDFVAAMADSSGRDLSQFMLWYGQAGTPEVSVARAYDREAGVLTLTFTQRTPPTPGQPEKLPLHMPIRMGFVGPGGEPMPVRIEGENLAPATERVLELTKAEESFRFIDLPDAPVPSLLRGFSAPVRLDAHLDPDQLALLLKHDTDPFNRWESAQRLGTDLLLGRIQAFHEGRPPAGGDALVGAFGVVLDGANEDPAFAARAATLPGRSYVAQALPQILVDAMDASFRAVQGELGRALGDRWWAIYDRLSRPDDSAIDTAAFGRRALKNSALAYLVWGEHPDALALTEQQYRHAATMTDRLGALRAIAERPESRRDELLDDFLRNWRHEPLVINKWLALQAGIEDAEAPERIARLLQHPVFTMTNPNRVRALLGTFAAANLIGFHRADGAGYRLLADKIIELDRINPQVAARLLTSFGRWRRFDGGRQGLMRAELERVAAVPGLSRDAFEIASKSLG
jgi:aminopeptidase N